MIAKRVGAIVLAAGLVVGAVFLRRAIDDNSSGDGNGSSSNGAYQLICSTEFTEVCSRLPDSYAVTIEPAGVTLDRLAKSEAADLPDAWLTLDPFPGMLDETRTRASNLSAAVKSTTVLATTDQLYAIPSDRSSAFESACDTAPVAKCVGEFAGQQWQDLGPTNVSGKVQPGIADPSNDAFGLLTFANGVAGFYGDTEIDSNAWSNDAEFDAWMRNYVSNVSIVTGSALNEMLVRPSSVNVAATSTAEISGTPRVDTLTTLPVSPDFGTHAVIAVIGRDRRDIAEQLETSLVDRGWDPPSDVAGLPASTFIALRQLWG